MPLFERIKEALEYSNSCRLYFRGQRSLYNLNFESILVAKNVSFLVADPALS